MPPLIVSLAMDAASQALLDRLRAEHFPPERNFLSAHLTLFHALDGARKTEILADLSTAAAAPRFSMRASGLRSLGRGVAFVVDSPPLLALRAGLAARWAGILTAQDRGKFQPHVTIQNKAAPEDARDLLARLRPAFVPFEIWAEGLTLSRYLGGPWEHVATARLAARGGE